MTDILQKWLRMQLHRSFPRGLKEFGNVMRDGAIVSELLHSYHIITDNEMNSVSRSSDLKIIQNNWKKLQVQLKKIRLDLNTNDLKNISEGRGSFTLGLFYRIYLELDNTGKVFVSKRVLKNEHEKYHINEAPSKKAKSVELNQKNIKLIDQSSCLSLTQVTFDNEISTDFTYEELRRLESKAQRNAFPVFMHNSDQNMPLSWHKNNNSASETVIEFSNSENQVSNELFNTKHDIVRTLITREKTQERERSSSLNEVDESINKEKVRFNVIHKKLENEYKIKQGALTFDICKDTTLAFIDFAFKCAEFQELMRDTKIPYKLLDEWKILFLTTQFWIDFENTNDKETESGKDSDSKILNMIELTQYQNETGMWNSTLTDDNSIHEIDHGGPRGSIILDNIICRSLASKYTSAKNATRLSMKRKKVAVVILGARDILEIQYFVDTLLKMDIEIVVPDSAVDYCLREFKEEFDYDIYETYNGDCPVSERNKLTQTPRRLPLSSKYSKPAQLGEMIFKMLQDGDRVTDALLTLAIVEYIYSLKCDTGWVLFDFPQNYDQAKLLEEKLTGQIIMPKYGNSLIEAKEFSLNNNSHQLCDKFDHSKNAKEFKTFFTRFLKLRKCSSVEREEFIGSQNLFDRASLDRFYAEQGILYTIYYEDFDSPTLNLIIEFLTGHTSISPKPLDCDLASSKSSMSISKPDFQSDNEEQNVKVFKHENISLIMNSATCTSPSDGRYINKGSQQIAVSALHDRVKMSSDGTDGARSSLDEPTSRMDVLDLPQSEDRLVSLANFWEFVESSYITDIKELLCAKSKILSDAVPYVKYIRNSLCRPYADDNKTQQLITVFTNKLNSRNCTGPGSGTSLYRKVAGLKQNLVDICKSEKLSLYDDSDSLNRENWLATNLTNLTNIAVNMIQAELKRSLQTLKLIYTYYMGSLFQTDLPLDELKMFDLPKLSVDAPVDFFKCDITTAGARIKSDESSCISSYMQDILIAKEKWSNKNNPFSIYISITISTVHEYMLTILKYYHDAREKAKSKLKGPGNVDLQKRIGNLKRAEIFETARSIQMKPNEKTVDVLQEWECATRNENDRLNRKLKIIQSKVDEDVSFLKNIVSETFLSTHAALEERFKRKLESIEILHNLLSAAIENGAIISSPLIIDSFDFIGKSNVLLDEIEYSQTYLDRFELPIDELQKLTDRLFLLYENCSVLKKHFIIILQDYFLIYFCEVQSENFWSRLDAIDFEIIVDRVYGDIDYVDWRDFIISLLNIPHPDEIQLLQLRTEYLEKDKQRKETVHKEDYLQVKLWFEPLDFCENRRQRTRSNSMKEYLFKLFRIGSEEINYSAFLLAFCKASIPERGFCKALAISIGKLINWSIKDGELFAEEKYTDPRKQAISHRSRISLADDFVNSWIHFTVGICNGVSLVECENYLNFFFTEKSTDESDGNASITPILLDDSHAAVEASTVYDTKNSIRSKSANSSVVTTNSGNFEIVFLVSEELVKRVLHLSLPWHCRMQFLKPFNDIIQGLVEMFADLKYTDQNDDVFSHRLIFHKFIQEYLHTIHKFTSRCSLRYVAEMVKKKERQLKLLESANLHHV